ncbi:anthranilate synthase component II [Halolamina salina]|uniref:anthranilate synthase n=1 Tax=Halolamina salina TaxID=1220023 RepID=A0ABD6B4L7_9EURY
MSAPEILVIDNYDSFVYNLVQYLGEAVQERDGAVTVRRNDAIDRRDIRDLDPDGIVVSPGPGTPAAAGVSMDVFDLDYPTLGVCLGHQALCAHNGAPVGHADAVVHGKPSEISHDSEGVFDGLPQGIRVGRYHSLAVDRDAIPDALAETATTDDEDVVMAVRHREKPHVGVQFHPESILTDHGKTMIRNFLGICREWER